MFKDRSKAGVGMPSLHVEYTQRITEALVYSLQDSTGCEEIATEQANTRTVHKLDDIIQRWYYDHYTFVWPP